MAVSATLGQGTRLYYSSNGSDYTELTDLVEIGPPGDPDIEQIEATPLNPTGNSREYLNGLEENGEFNFSQYWTKGRQTTLRAIRGLTRYYKVVCPDNATPANASTYVFQGNLRKCQPAGFRRGQPVQIDCRVQLTSAITFTEGS